MKNNEELLQKAAFPKLILHLCIPTIVNIVLDPVLIMGLHMGVAGAAIATVAGNVVSAVYLLYYVLWKQKLFSLRPGDVSLTKDTVLPVLTVATGTLLTCICFLCRQQFVTAFIDHAEVIALGQKMIVASMLIGPFYGLYQLSTTFLQATGKAGFATVVSLLDKGAVFIPMLYLLNALFGLDGVIYTAAVTDMISILVGGALCLYWNKKLGES